MELQDRLILEKPISGSWNALFVSAEGATDHTSMPSSGTEVLLPICHSQFFSAKKKILTVGVIHS